MEEVKIYKPFENHECSHRFAMLEGDKVICYMTIKGVTKSAINDGGSSYAAFYQVLDMFKEELAKA